MVQVMREKRWKSVSLKEQHSRSGSFRWGAWGSCSTCPRVVVKGLLAGAAGENGRQGASRTAIFSGSSSKQEDIVLRMKANPFKRMPGRKSVQPSHPAPLISSKNHWIDTKIARSPLRYDVSAFVLCPWCNLALSGCMKTNHMNSCHNIWTFYHRGFL